jgi:hypothetical protein
MDMSSAFVVGSGIGLLFAAVAIAYAQYLHTRRPERLRGLWGRLAALTGSPRRAAAYVTACAVGWLAGAAITEALGLGTLPRDAQLSLLMLFLTVAVLALGVFVVWTRAPAKPS